MCHGFQNDIGCIKKLVLQMAKHWKYNTVLSEKYEIFDRLFSILRWKGYFRNCRILLTFHIQLVKRKICRRAKELSRKIYVDELKSNSVLKVFFFNNFDHLFSWVLLRVFSSCSYFISYVGGCLQAFLILALNFFRCGLWFVTLLEQSIIIIGDANFVFFIQFVVFFL